MYTIPHFPRTTITETTDYEAEHLETKIERKISNKEPVEGDHPAPIIFTERKDGVHAAYNIRTDRFEIAIDAADKIAKSYSARREERGKAAGTDGKPAGKNEGKGDGGAEPIQAKPTT